MIGMPLWAELLLIGPEKSKKRLLPMASTAISNVSNRCAYRTVLGGSICNYDFLIDCNVNFKFSNFGQSRNFKNTPTWSHDGAKQKIAKLKREILKKTTYMYKATPLTVKQSKKVVSAFFICYHNRGVNHMTPHNSA